MRKFYSNWKNRLWAVLLIATIFGFNARATVWPIPNTTADTLDKFMDAIDLWEPGDTIMLSSSSIYIANGTMDFFQSATVMGDPELDIAPTIKFEDNGFRAKADSVDIAIIGLKLDGYKTDGNRANFALRFDQSYDTTWWGDVLIEDCDIWGFTGVLQGYKNKWGVYESFTMNNCIVHDIYGQYAIDPYLNAIKELTVTNSTFYDIGHGFIKNVYFSDGTRDTIAQVVTVDHNTFWKVAGEGNKGLLQFNDGHDSSIDLVFSNNIVQTLWYKPVWDMRYYARPFMLSDDGGDFLIRNSCFFDYYSEYQGGIHNLDTVVQQSNVDTFAIYRDNPMFADTLYANFTIGAGNPLLTAATDGGAIGDPRWVSEKAPWVPGPNVHMIPNTATDTLDKFMDAIDLWAPGDTILLVSASTYIANGTMDFFQSATVMGDPRLSVKPTIKFEDNGFRAKADSVDISIIGLNLDGYKTDGNRANFALRFDQAYDTTWWGDVLIEDCDIWGFTGVLQGYKNKWGVYESFTINNCIVHDIYGQYAIDPFLNAIKELTVTNSTFYDVGHGFLKNVYFSDGTRDTIAQVINVDHNTFWKVAGEGNKGLLQFNDGHDESIDLTFSNNIVKTLWYKPVWDMRYYARPFMLSEDGGTFTIENSCFYDYYSEYQGGIHNLDTVVNQANVDTAFIYKIDPMYADTLTANFLLPQSSELLGAGTDGSAIGDPRWVPVMGVTINDLTEQVFVGYDITLTAQVNVGEGNDESVTWSVVDGTGSATIDASTGVLSPTAAGTVTVTATSNFNPAVSGDLDVTIVEPTLITSISLEGSLENGAASNEIANKGGILYITATVMPGDATDKTLTWTYADATDGDATLTEEAATRVKLIGVDCGSVFVVATANDGSQVADTFEVVITNQLTAESVTVAGQDGATEITSDGGTLQMLADIVPASNCSPEMQWSVDDETIATIDANGVLTAVSDGTVEVSCKVFSAGAPKTGTATITISNQVSAVKGLTVGNVKVMPNPAKDVIFIQTEETAEVTITSLVGATMMVETVEPNASIDVSGLNTGVYIVNIRIDNELSTVRLVKE